MVKKASKILSRFGAEIGSPSLLTVSLKLVRSSTASSLIVLSHLADNAMRHKATAIRMEAVDARTTLLLTVSNDGEPISAPNRDRIFDAFFTTRRDQGGTGMGLAIARAVMASHGGSIRLRPTDEGAAFELQFPVA